MLKIIQADSSQQMCTLWLDSTRIISEYQQSAKKGEKPANSTVPWVRSGHVPFWHTSLWRKNIVQSLRLEDTDLTVLVLLM